MTVAFALDPDQGLRQGDEQAVVRLAAELGYESAWTNAGPDAAAFDRCLRWFEASGLPTGISAVPASGQPPEFYAEQAMRLSEKTGGKFTLVVGSGVMSHAAAGMRRYLPEVRSRLPKSFPLYLAALGPLMLKVAGELADGVSLNWCSPEQITWSRQRVEEAARAAGRPVPRIVEYIRTAVDPDGQLAQKTVGMAAGRYLRFDPYRRHFERMGVAEELQRLVDSNGQTALGVVRSVGAAGKPGETRQEFERLSKGLDLPIVRVLVTRPGDVDSARRVLEECRPSV